MRGLQFTVALNTVYYCIQVCSVAIWIQLVGHLSPLPPLWFLLDTQTSLATQSCLITMRWITLPITATQSDFHDPVGAACSQLSRNYSPCTYRKPSSAAQPVAVTLVDWQTHIHEWTHTLTWKGNLHKYAVRVIQRHLYVCMYIHVRCRISSDYTPNISYFCLDFTQMVILFSHAVLTLHRNTFMTTHTSIAPF